MKYKKEIETLLLLAHAIEDSTDIFGISGGGGGTPQPPRYATDLHSSDYSGGKEMSPGNLSLL